MRHPNDCVSTLFCPFSRYFCQRRIASVQKSLGEWYSPHVQEHLLLLRASLLAVFLSLDHNLSKNKDYYLYTTPEVLRTPATSVFPTQHRK